MSELSDWQAGMLAAWDTIAHPKRLSRDRERERRKQLILSFVSKERAKKQVVLKFKNEFPATELIDELVREGRLELFKGPNVFYSVRLLTFDKQTA